MSQPLDQDPYIPTGVAASPEQVAAMLADEALPEITPEVVALLPDWQQPVVEQVADAVEDETGIDIVTEQDLVVEVVDETPTVG
jgi:hypothetical protein